MPPPFKKTEKQSLNIRWLKEKSEETYANGDPLFTYTLQTFDPTTDKWIDVPAFMIRNKTVVEKTEAPTLVKSY